jgi:hypothetical protein
MNTDRSNVASQKLLKMFAKDLLWNVKNGICSPEYDQYKANKKAEWTLMRQLFKIKTVTSEVTVKLQADFMMQMYA